MKHETEAFMARVRIEGTGCQRAGHRGYWTACGRKACLGSGIGRKWDRMNWRPCAPRDVHKQGKEDGARVVAVVSDKIEQAKPESSQTTAIDHARADRYDLNYFGQAVGEVTAVRVSRQRASSDCSGDVSTDH
jgi:hypothetical protein